MSAKDAIGGTPKLHERNACPTTDGNCSKNSNQFDATTNLFPTIAGIPSREMTGEYASSVRPAATPSAMTSRRSSEDLLSTKKERASHTQAVPSGYSMTGIVHSPKAATTAKVI